MVVAILLALHDELRVVPRQEYDGVLRLYVFSARLAIEFADALPVGSIVADQTTVILVAVQLKHVDGLRVGAPCDVGEVAVGGVAGLQIDGLAALHVVDADSHLVARHACHRIFVGLFLGHARVDVHLRIVAHLGLVHAVEGQTQSVGAPEKSLHDAELIAVYGLAVDNLPRAVGSELCFAAFGIAHEELVVACESQCTRGLVPFLVRLACLDFLPPHNLLALEVVEHAFLVVAQQHPGLLSVRILRIHG